MLLVNTFEGGSNGTTISTANSGGVSGNPFDAFASTPTFSTTVAHSGTLCMSATTGAQKQVEWNTTSLGTGNATLFGRCYFQTTGNAGVRIVQGDGATTSDIFRITLVTTTSLIAVNINGGTNVSSTTALANNTWMRIDFQFALSGTTATITARLFFGANIEGTVPTETLTQSGASTDAAINIIRFGSGSSVTPTLFFDDVAVTDQGYPGPLLRPAYPIRSVVPQVMAGARR